MQLNSHLKHIVDLLTAFSSVADYQGNIVIYRLKDEVTFLGIYILWLMCVDQPAELSYPLSCLLMNCCGSTAWRCDLMIYCKHHGMSWEDHSKDGPLKTYSFY